MILVDINVLIDVLHERKPHFGASSKVIEQVALGRVTACLSAHGLTTLHYLTLRAGGKQAAAEAVDWALRLFEIAPVGAEELKRAFALNWTDFEDAVVAAAAESSGCDSIITRNTRDFRGSPVPAMPPEELVINEVHESLVANYG